MDPAPALPTIAGTVSTILETASTVLSTVQSNALLMIFAASGVVAIGIKIVKKLIGRY